MHRKQSKPTRIDTLPTSKRRPIVGKLLQQVMGAEDGAGEGEPMKNGAESLQQGHGRGECTENKATQQG